MSNVLVKDIAKICHQANKAYCEVMGDYSQVDWDFASEELQNSAINGVQFHIDNPDSSSADSHNNWYKFRSAQGWVYGDIKDEKLKTHPCMVPYDHLPVAQQKKDKLFKSIVKIINK